MMRLASGLQEGYQAILIRRHVWVGVGIGLFVCLAIGAGLIGALYTLDQDYFNNIIEDIWEVIFGIIASAIISIMGAAPLRVNKTEDMRQVKLMKVLETKDCSISRSNSSFMSKIKIYGVSLGLLATFFPIVVIIGLTAGCLVAYFLDHFNLLLVPRSCRVVLQAVWYPEPHECNQVIGGDAAETDSGPGSYGIRKSVWYVNYCNPEINRVGDWRIFNAVLGWAGIPATYRTAISSNLLLRQPRISHWTIQCQKLPRLGSYYLLLKNRFIGSSQNVKRMRNPSTVVPGLLADGAVAPRLTVHVLCSSCIRPAPYGFCFYPIDKSGVYLSS
ncbi:plasma membrane iron permease [Xylaria longipes]|nr:plasma membrane iron permease [Xylaria longipes]